jgi:hypothetical protein
MPSRRQYLAALGAGGALAGGAGVTGAITLPYLSPAWERWRTLVGGVGRSVVLAVDRLFLTSEGALVCLNAAPDERR